MADYHVTTMESHSLDDYKALKLKLSGYTKPGQELFRNVLFDQLYASMPTDSPVKVQIYNAGDRGRWVHQLALPQRRDVLHRARGDFRSDV